MNIRTASLEDLEAISQLEAICFPANEAASKESFQKRLTHYNQHFWLMFDEDQLIAFVNGMVTNQADLSDNLYEEADLHIEKGDWQMIFGVNTHPDYRKKGYAGQLIRCLIQDAKESKRKGVVLTCKKELIPYYQTFGFVDEGIAPASTHGGVVWHQMRLRFD